MGALKLGNRWYIPQIETVYTVLSPIVVSCPLSLRANAYCLQNAGNCDILLSSGFTLAPGQNQWFGNYAELNIMYLDITVKFLPATATAEPVIQRLEIVEVTAKFKGSGYWIDQPQMDIQNIVS